MQSLTLKTDNIKVTIRWQGECCQSTDILARLAPMSVVVVQTKSLSKNQFQKINTRSSHLRQRSQRSPRLKATPCRIALFLLEEEGVVLDLLYNNVEGWADISWPIDFVVIRGLETCGALGRQTSFVNGKAQEQERPGAERDIHSYISECTSDAALFLTTVG